MDLLGVAFSLAEIILASTLPFSDDLRNKRGGNRESENNTVRHNPGGHPCRDAGIYFLVCRENSRAKGGTSRVYLRRHETGRGGPDSADRAFDRAQARNAI